MKEAIQDIVSDVSYWEVIALVVYIALLIVAKHMKSKLLTFKKKKDVKTISTKNPETGREKAINGSRSSVGRRFGRGRKSR